MTFQPDKIYAGTIVRFLPGQDGKDDRVVVAANGNAIPEATIAISKLFLSGFPVPASIPDFIGVPVAYTVYIKHDGLKINGITCTAPQITYAMMKDWSRTARQVTADRNKATGLNETPVARGLVGTIKSYSHQYALIRTDEAGPDVLIPYSILDGMSLKKDHRVVFDCIPNPRAADKDNAWVATTVRHLDAEKIPVPITTDAKPITNLHATIDMYDAELGFAVATINESGKQGKKSKVIIPAKVMGDAALGKGDAVILDCMPCDMPMAKWRATSVKIATPTAQAPVKVSTEKFAGRVTKLPRDERYAFIVHDHDPRTEVKVSRRLPDGSVLKVGDRVLTDRQPNPRQPSLIQGTIVEREPMSRPLGMTDAELEAMVVGVSRRPVEVVKKGRRARGATAEGGKATPASGIAADRVTP